jgi:membrane protease YdiL (CAAX protease family)
MKKIMRDTIRPIGLTLIGPVAGFVVIFFIEAFGNTEVGKLPGALINLIVVGVIALILFPRLLGIPFGRIETAAFLKKLGFYVPKQVLKHLALGVVLAAFTLSGMLVASMLTGKYTLDASTINLPHLVFGLNPALWEELFYRGVLMALLIRQTRSVKKAAVIQILLFGLSHIKGLDAWAFVDVFSVMIIAIGFTYVAYKTRALVAGIVFHYVHDALLFFVQLQTGIQTGIEYKILFYGLLWLMVGIGILITRIAADKWGVRAEAELYLTE